MHILYTCTFCVHECLLGTHAQACYWLYLRTWNWAASSLPGQLIQQLLTLEVERDLPAQSRVNQSRLLRNIPSQFFNISKDENSTASLGNLFQCLTTLTLSFFLPSNGIYWFWCVPTAVSPFTGYHCGESGSFFFASSHQVFIYNDKSHPNLLI